LEIASPFCEKFQISFSTFLMAEQSTAFPQVAQKWQPKFVGFGGQNFFDGA